MAGKRCTATKADGKPCGNWALPGREFCRHHGKERSQAAILAALEPRPLREGDPIDQVALTLAVMTLANTRGAREAAMGLALAKLKEQHPDPQEADCDREEERLEQVIRDVAGEESPPRLAMLRSYPTRELMDKIAGVLEWLQAGAKWWLDEAEKYDRWLAAGGEEGAAEAPALRQAPEFFVHTSQEWTAILQAAADGKYGDFYSDNEQAGVRVHARPESPFYTRITLLEEERDAGFGVDLLKQLTDRQDADSAIALLYISHCLAPPSPLPPHGYAGGWIDLDDAAKKIGLLSRSARETEEHRAFIWDCIRFGARAHIVGERSIPYYDQATRELIPTRIETPLWAAMSRERPAQLCVFDCLAVPLRVELVMSREWTALTTAPETAQYLPLGEVLGRIPGNQPGGAWARAIALAYLGFCRRNPREVLAGVLKPTREELLARYKPKKSPYDELLESEHPLRAVEYWSKALRILAEKEIGFFANSGEATKPIAEWKCELRAKGSRKRWQDGWRTEEADLMPGPRLLPAVEACAGALPPIGAPRALPRARRRRGRPRKPGAEE